MSAMSPYPLAIADFDTTATKQTGPRNYSLCWFLEMWINKLRGHQLVTVLPMYRKVEKATLQIDDNGTGEQRGKNGRSGSLRDGKNGEIIS